MKPLIINVPDKSDSGKSHVSIIAFSFKFKQQLKDVGVYSGPLYDNSGNNNSNHKNKKFNKRNLGGFFAFY